MFRAKGIGVSFSAILAFACAAQVAAIPQSPAKTSSEAAPQAASKAAELYRQALALSGQRKFDEARPLLEQAIEAARAEKNAAIEAHAEQGLARYYHNRAEYAKGLPHIERALALYDAAASPNDAAQAHTMQGMYFNNLGQNERAVEHFRAALPLFERAGNLLAKANALRNVALMHVLPAEQNDTLYREAITVAQQVGDRGLEGSLLRDLADSAFTRGSFGGALELLEQSAAILSAAKDYGELAFTYTSTGRLLRAHGQPERAIEMYGKALTLQENIGDQLGIMQTNNAMGVALGVLGRHREAIERYQHALNLALASGSERYVDFLRAALAGSYANLGQHARATELLEEIIRRGKDNALEFRHYRLAESYLALGRYADALAANGRAARTAVLQHVLPAQRARVLAKLGRFEEALAEVREASRLLEELRAKSATADFLRQGFSEANQYVAQTFVAVLMEAGRASEALELAERARGRAFLDLLATREIALKPAIAARVADLRHVDASLRRAGAGAAQPAETVSALPLTLRGSASKSPAASLLLDTWKNADPELRSLVVAEPFSVSELAAVARRLRSTVLSYWVSADAVHIWVVHPTGKVDAATSTISSEQLAQLVKDATSATLGSPRGEQEAGDGGAAALRDITLRARGASTLRMNNSSRAALSALYDLLIRPVRSLLPAKPGSRLTLVPHGSLFWLPFAALRDERGRYLIERYELHYTPAGAVLEFTRKKQPAAVARAQASVLLIADPARMPATGAAEPLGALPGTRTEAAAIARLLPAGQSATLSGAGARESDVRARLANIRILHFATHGIVRDDDALESFLALGASSTASAEDGRLTTQEIYGLDLQADLVFLSACRSGRGKISGDGIIGLTRAFIYAGTPSVVATLWDVADETTELLVPEFYRGYLKDGNRSRALRAAQLRMLRDLRAGRVKIPTAAGLFTLPEHPALWASFVLVGEP